jgi:hypothetical protein
MNRPVVGTAIAAVVISLFAGAAMAQTQSAKAKAAHAKPAAKSEAKPAASEAAQPVSQTQLDIASRVLTGTAQCEFDERVSLQAADGAPGHFKLAFKNVSYNMVPEETTTGAVRLEDKKAGVVWVQIPQKSMLLNSKIGQRMVDGCTQVEQRVASR